MPAHIHTNMEGSHHHGHHGMSFFRTITLKIPGMVAPGNQGTEFSFPDLGDLRYARTIAIEAFAAEDIAFAQPEPIAVIPIASFPKVQLVLKTNDPERKDQGSDGRFTSTIDSVRYLPLSAIHRIQSNSNSPFVFELMRFLNTWVLWEQSTVKLSPGGLGNTTDVCIYIGVWYTFFNLEGKPVKRT